MINQNESGETAAQISKRTDDEHWARILSALEDGAILRIHTKVRRAAIEGLPERDSRNGLTISASRAKTMQRKGVLREIGMDKFVLTEFGLKEQENKQ